jgi:hypothetical protein
LIYKQTLKNMAQLTKQQRIQILNDKFYVLNKFYTKQNGEETYCIIQFSGNTNTIGDMKQTIKYSEIQHMNNELEIIDYLKK